MNQRLVLLCTTLLALTGCVTAAQHNRQLGSMEEDRLTVAAVQREIQVGMSGAAVLTALGSPNIVSTDEDRNEIWVYDRVGTEYVYSNSGTGIISLVGASGGVAGGVMPTHNQNAGATRRSQRTLTIVIRFDEDDRVADYSYHASRF